MNSVLRSRIVIAAVCGLLCLAVILVFCQTGNYDFVNYDDDEYVYTNPHVNGGLTWDGLIYFTYHRHEYIYHPLSTYTHMLDCQLYGLAYPGGHHLTNILLHAASTVLLFLLLRQMTGRLWPSALVAAVFAVHPLHVQSVAWVAERKDVLSGLFFVLTLGAYVRYVRAEARDRNAGIWPAFTRRYTLVCLLFALGLLAKPMLVTLPMVLLLLDYWPLGRWRTAGDQIDDQIKTSGETEIGDMAAVQVNDAGTTPALVAEAAAASAPQKARPIPWHLFVEKIPLLLLALADSALTVFTEGNAIQTLDYISWRARIANALVSYVSYLGCFFWPKGLAVLYPHPIAIALKSRPAIGAAVFLAVVLVCVFACRRRAPYLLVGWLWYLGMLVPVIGLLQVGGQSMADRYTYLPLIGLAVGLVWAAADVTGWLIHVANRSVRRASFLVLALSSAGIIAALVVGAWQQTTYWRDSEALWRRDLMYPNCVAYYDLGLTLAASNRHEEAIEEFDQALACSPKDEDTLVSYGQSLEALGRVDEAIKKYREALAVNKKSEIAIARLAAIARARAAEGKDSGDASHKGTP